MNYSRVYPVSEGRKTVVRMTNFGVTGEITGRDRVLSVSFTVLPGSIGHHPSSY